VHHKSLYCPFYTREEILKFDMVSRGKYILSQFGLFVRELRIFGGCYVAGGTAVTCSRRNCPKQTNTKGNDFEDYSLLLSCTSLNVPFCPVYKPVVLSLDSLVCGTLFFLTI